MSYKLLTHDVKSDLCFPGLSLVSLVHGHASKPLAMVFFGEVEN